MSVTQKSRIDFVDLKFRNNGHEVGSHRLNLCEDTASEAGDLLFIEHEICLKRDTLVLTSCSMGLES